MSSRKHSRVGRPSKFPPEFRRDAVAMVLDEDRSIADVGRAVGVNPGHPTARARPTLAPFAAYGIHDKIRGGLRATLDLHRD